MLQHDGGEPPLVDQFTINAQTCHCRGWRIENRYESRIAWACVLAIL